MDYPGDLLHQAELLARHDRRRPRQANLRRAVSSAYYALFHLLAASGAARLLSGAGREPARVALSRSFEHKAMADACKDLARGAQSKLRVALGGATVPQQLLDVARAFVELQEARHRADYDLSVQFSRQEALGLVQSAAQAFADWDASRKTVPADVLLAAMVAPKGFSR